MPANDDLADLGLQHAVELQRLTIAQQDKINRLLRTLAEELAGKLQVGGMAPLTEKRAKALIAQAAATVERGYDRIAAQHLADMRKLAGIESDFARVHLDRAIGSPVSTVILSPAQLAALADDTLIEGRFSRDWWKVQSDDIAARTAQQITNGFLAGEGIDKIVQRIIGKPGAPGVVDMAPHRAEALVRTSVQNVAAAARFATYKDNADLIKGVQWLSTLDARTSDICKGLSGLAWTLDGEPIGHDKAFQVPPAHWNAIAGGTLITTQRGDVPVEQVREGDLALTHRGRLMPIYAVMRKASETGRLIVLQTDTGRVLRLTDEHPVLTSRAGWKRADQIETGDVLFEDAAQLERIEGQPRVDLAADHYPPPLQEPEVFDEIRLLSAGVPATVHLQRDLGRREGEVDDVGADDVLMHGPAGEDADHRAFCDRRLLATALGQPSAMLHMAELAGIVGLHPGAGPGIESVGVLGVAPRPMVLALEPLDGFPHREARCLGLAAHGDVVAPAPCAEHRLADPEVALDAAQRPAAGDVLAPDQLDQSLPRPAWRAATVVGISHVIDPGEVFNLAIVTDETYCANGIVVHNCRSTIIAVLKSWDELSEVKIEHRGKTIGFERAFRARLKTRGLDEDKINRAIADAQASMDGQVAADLDYERWLRAKDAASPGWPVQARVLTQAKYDLWKANKITLRDLIDQSGNPLTLDELQDLVRRRAPVDDVVDALEKAARTAEGIAIEEITRRGLWQKIKDFLKAELLDNQSISEAVRDHILDIAKSKIRTDTRNFVLDVLLGPDGAKVWAEIYRDLTAPLPWFLRMVLPEGVQAPLRRARQLYALARWLSRQGHPPRRPVDIGEAFFTDRDRLPDLLRQLPPPLPEGVTPPQVTGPLSLKIVQRAMASKLIVPLSLAPKELADILAMLPVGLLRQRATRGRVNIDRMIAIRDTVERSDVEKLLDSDDVGPEPLLLRVGGWGYLIEGEASVVAAMVRGRTDIVSQVIDFFRDLPPPEPLRLPPPEPTPEIFLPGQPRDIGLSPPLQIWKPPHGENELASWDTGHSQLAGPPMPHPPTGKHRAFGTVVIEDDGRIWLRRPSQGFAGGNIGFPKGKLDPDFAPDAKANTRWQATAIKETWEETGLKVDILGWLADVESSTALNRWYLAKRVDGAPWDMGWESDQVHLVTPQMARQLIGEAGTGPTLDVLRETMGVIGEAEAVGLSTLAAGIAVVLSQRADEGRHAEAWQLHNLLNGIGPADLVQAAIDFAKLNDINALTPKAALQQIEAWRVAAHELDELLKHTPSLIAKTAAMNAIPAAAGSPQKLAVAKAAMAAVTAIEAEVKPGDQFAAVDLPLVETVPEAVRTIIGEAISQPGVSLPIAAMAAEAYTLSGGFVPLASLQGYILQFDQPDLAKRATPELAAALAFVGIETGMPSMPLAPNTYQAQVAIANKILSGKYGIVPQHLAMQEVGSHGSAMGAPKILIDNVNVMLGIDLPPPMPIPSQSVVAKWSEPTAQFFIDQVEAGLWGAAAKATAKEITTLPPSKKALQIVNWMLAEQIRLPPSKRNYPDEITSYLGIFQPDLPSLPRIPEDAPSAVKTKLQTIEAALMDLDFRTAWMEQEVFLKSDAPNLQTQDIETFGSWMHAAVAETKKVALQKWPKLAQIADAALPSHPWLTLWQPPLVVHAPFAVTAFWRDMGIDLIDLIATSSDVGDLAAKLAGIKTWIDKSAPEEVRVWFHFMHDITQAAAAGKLPQVGPVKHSDVGWPNVSSQTLNAFLPSTGGRALQLAEDYASAGQTAAMKVIIDALLGHDSVFPPDGSSGSSLQAWYDNIVVLEAEAAARAAQRLETKAQRAAAEAAKEAHAILATVQAAQAAAQEAPPPATPLGEGFTLVDFGKPPGWTQVDFMLTPMQLVKKAMAHNWPHTLWPDATEALVNVLAAGWLGQDFVPVGVQLLDVGVQKQVKALADFFGSDKRPLPMKWKPVPADPITVIFREDGKVSPDEAFEEVVAGQWGPLAKMMVVVAEKKLGITHAKIADMLLDDQTFDEGVGKLDRLAGVWAKLMETKLAQRPPLGPPIQAAKPPAPAPAPAPAPPATPLDEGFEMVDLGKPTTGWPKEISTITPVQLIGFAMTHGWSWLTEQAIAALVDSMAAGWLGPTLVPVGTQMLLAGIKTKEKLLADFFGSDKAPFLKKWKPVPAKFEDDPDVVIFNTDVTPTEALGQIATGAWGPMAESALVEAELKTKTTIAQIEEMFAKDRIDEAVERTGTLAHFWMEEFNRALTTVPAPKIPPPVTVPAPKVPPTATVPEPRFISSFEAATDFVIEDWGKPTKGWEGFEDATPLDLLLLGKATSWSIKDEAVDKLVNAMAAGWLGSDLAPVGDQLLGHHKAIQTQYLLEFFGTDKNPYPMKWKPVPKGDPTDVIKKGKDGSVPAFTGIAKGEWGPLAVEAYNAATKTTGIDAAKIAATQRRYGLGESSVMQETLGKQWLENVQIAFLGLPKPTVQPLAEARAAAKAAQAAPLVGEVIPPTPAPAPIVKIGGIDVIDYGAPLNWPTHLHHGPLGLLQLAMKIDWKLNKDQIHPLVHAIAAGWLGSGVKSVGESLLRVPWPEQAALLSGFFGHLGKSGEIVGQLVWKPKLLSKGQPAVTPIFPPPVAAPALAPPAPVSAKTITIGEIEIVDHGPPPNWPSSFDPQTPLAILVLAMATDWTLSEDRQGALVHAMAAGWLGEGTRSVQFVGKTLLNVEAKEQNTWLKKYFGVIDKLTGAITGQKEWHPIGAILTPVEILEDTDLMSALDAIESGKWGPLAMQALELAEKDTDLTKEKIANISTFEEKAHALVQLTTNWGQKARPLLEAALVNKPAFPRVGAAPPPPPAAAPVPAPAFAPVPAPAPGLPALDAAISAFAPLPKAAATGRIRALATKRGHLLLEDFVKVGEKTKGNVPGGVYEHHVTGERWMIKEARSTDEARNEVLAGSLYRLAGVLVPDLALVSVGGKEYIASKMVEDYREDIPAILAGDHRDIRRNFIIDAWLANWDVAGLKGENMGFTGDRVIRIDVGGALRYRGMQGLKGAAFGPTVGEIDSLRNKSLNRTAAMAFAKVTTADVEAGMCALRKIEPSEIWNTIERFGPYDLRERRKLGDLMIARKRDLQTRFPAPKAKPLPASAAELDVISNEELALLRSAGIAGWARPTDVDAVEDNMVLLFETLIVDRPATAAWFKVTQETLDATVATVQGSVTTILSAEMHVDSGLLSGEVFAVYSDWIKEQTDANAKLDRINALGTKINNDITILVGELAATKRVQKKLSGDKAMRVDKIERALTILRAISRDATRLYAMITKGDPDTSRDFIKLMEAGKFPDFQDSIAITPTRGGVATTERDWSFPSTVLSHTIAPAIAPALMPEITSLAGPDLPRVLSDVSHVRVAIGNLGDLVIFTDKARAAMRGLVMARIEGRGRKAVTDLLRAIEKTTGIPMRRATQDDLLLTYAARTAYLFAKNDPDGFLAITEEPPEKRLALYRDFIARWAGVHLDDMPEFDPNPVPSLYGIGPFMQFRPDIDPNSSEWRAFADGHRLVHYLAESNLRPVLFNGAALRGQLDRFRIGFTRKVGSSENTDMKTGGGNAAYFRINKINEISTLSSHGVRFVFHVDILRRLDAISYGTDKYGKTADRKEIIEDRKVTIKQFEKASLNGSNETFVKWSHSLWDQLEFIIVPHHLYDGLMTDLAAMGIVTWPDGRKLADVLIKGKN